MLCCLRPPDGTKALRYKRLSYVTNTRDIKCHVFIHFPQCYFCVCFWRIHSSSRDPLIAPWLMLYETKGSSVAFIWALKWEKCCKWIFSKRKEFLNYYFDLFSVFKLGSLRQEAVAWQLTPSGSGRLSAQRPLTYRPARCPWNLPAAKRWNHLKNADTRVFQNSSVQTVVP